MARSCSWFSRWDGSLSIMVLYVYWLAVERGSLFVLATIVCLEWVVSIRDVIYSYLHLAPMPRA